MAVEKALVRLAAKGRVRRIRKDFYVIIPVEYSTTGMIPYDWFIDDLMQSLGQSYYVGLQSAAALHGAAHQQIQQVQIVTPKQERSIECKGLSIRFFTKAGFDGTPLVSRKGHSGTFPVSSPEATALDLVRYARRLGGLDTVTTILTELAEAMEPGKLSSAVRAEEELSHAQRLGWLLDHLKQDRLAEAVHQALSARKSIARIRLDSSGPWGGHTGNNRWRVVANATPEADV
ncbi:MAG TPA: type IV toxin-antitoxin system AbiEi family antitoxin [Kiritimatiellia bacterium]|nr:type IV toxin-antitoxin system AbiEi family antitoxin [Kiritimatiellia bacterium]